MEDSNAVSAAETREVLEERLNKRHGTTYPLAPLLEDDARERYVFVVSHWEEIRERASVDLPADPHESRYISRFLSPTRTARSLSRALTNGDVSLLNYHNGLTNSSVPMSAPRKFLELQRRLRQDGYLATFAGETNDGKSNFAWLLAELALLDQPDLTLLSNSSSLRLPDELEGRHRLVENYHKLEYLLQEFPDRKWLIVLDEMSTNASGYQSDRQDVETHMRRLTRYLAKYSARLVVIGHDGDIHPVIRDFADDFIVVSRQRQSAHDNPDDDEFRAEFYDGVASDDARQPVDHKLTVPDVPETGLNYNPDEKTRWSFAEPT